MRIVTKPEQRMMIRRRFLFLEMNVLSTWNHRGFVYSMRLVPMWNDIVHEHKS
jgi:hypothetical protein